MEYKYKGHRVKIEANQTAPQIIQLALWICDERISPIAGSAFEARSTNSVEAATAYARTAAKQIIDKRITDFAPIVDMTPEVLEEILDCIQSKHAYAHAANLLRTQYKTPLSTELWSKIKKWVKDAS